MSKYFRLSKNGMKRLFLICAAFIHFWAVLRFLDQLDWLQDLGLWQMVGFFSYMVLLASLEAVLVWVLLMGISILLPKSWTEDQMVLFLGNFAIRFWPDVQQHGPSLGACLNQALDPVAPGKVRLICWLEVP